MDIKINVSFETWDEYKRYKNVKKNTLHDLFQILLWLRRQICISIFPLYLNRWEVHSNVCSQAVTFAVQKSGGTGQ